VSDAVLEIKPVQKDLTKFVVGLASRSGDGKTRSALEVAYGLADFNPSRIGILDTENGRASLYSDVFKGRKTNKGTHKFLTGNLEAPFSPDRYMRGMRQFAEHELDVLIIDSTSHEHEGQGGLEEYAHRPKNNGEPRKMPDWLGAKRLHKQFVGVLLNLPFHIICCVRAREKMDFRNPDKPFSLGVQPICEKNLMFEMTISFMLKEQGKHRDVMKLSDDFEPLVGRDGYLTPEHGKALRDWLGDVDPIERAKSGLKLAASQGTETLKVAWSLLTKEQQKTLETFKNTLKDSAGAADLDLLVQDQEKKRDAADAWPTA